MPRDHAVVAGEILDAIAGIEAAIGSRSFEEYVKDWTLCRAVERGLEIVSEASRHLPNEWTDDHPEIPWRKVRALGNILRHDYHNLVDRILWTICADDLPPLKAAVAEMLRRHANEPKSD